MVVTLRGQGSHKEQQSRQVIARVFIESHVPFSNLATADGATWLDRKLLSKEPVKFRDKGFGAEANRALRLRQQWLLREELMTEQNGQLIVRRKLLETLQRRELNRVVTKLQKELGLNYRPEIVGGRLKGQIRKSIKLASGLFAIMQKGKEFSLVPWQSEIVLKQGKGRAIGKTRTFSR